MADNLLESDIIAATGKQKYYVEVIWRNGTRIMANLKALKTRTWDRTPTQLCWHLWLVAHFPPLYKIFHDGFQIIKYFRFEGQSDPADESILYAISSDKYQLTGVLVNGYGISSEPITNEMLDKLRTK